MILQTFHIIIIGFQFYLYFCLHISCQLIACFQTDRISPHPHFQGNVSPPPGKIVDLTQVLGSDSSSILESHNLFGCPLHKKVSPVELPISIFDATIHHSSGREFYLRYFLSWLQQRLQAFFLHIKCQDSTFI